MPGNEHWNGCMRQKKEKRPGRPRVNAGSEIRFPVCVDDPETSVFFQSRWAPLLTVLCVTGVVRIIHFLIILETDPSFDNILQGIDTYTYDEWSMRILEGDWISRKPPIFHMGPLYPYFLAVIYGLFGHLYAAAHLVQFALTTLACGAVFIAGTHWFSRRVAFTGALMAALCPNLLFHESALLPEALLIFLFSLFFLFLALICSRPDRLWIWLLLGVTLGLTAVQRGNSLLCAIGVAFWLIFCFENMSWLKRGVFFGLFLSGILLAISPATLHNRLLGGQWVLITSNGPTNLYLGNGHGAKGIFGYPPRFKEYRAEHLKLSDEINRLNTDMDTARRDGETERLRKLGRKISSVTKKREHFWSNKLFSDIGEAPGEWVRLMFKKVCLFGSAYDPPDNFSFDLAKRFSPIVDHSPFTYGVLMAAGLAGMVVSWRHWKLLFPIYAFGLTFFISVIVVFVSGRYRLPLIPCLSLFAAVFAWQAANWVFQARYRLLTGGVAAAGVLWMALNSYREYPYRIRPNHFRAYSSYYEMDKKPVEAVALLEQAEIYYGQWEPGTQREAGIRLAALHSIRNTLAKSLIRRELWDEAEEVLLRLIAGRTAKADHIIMLIHTSVKQGKISTGMDISEKMARENPLNKDWQRLPE
jgi:4-amino-4-deoxy-L-arabinose transferase-like glycosyltransferase